jgi:hypothetical protein
LIILKIVILKHINDKLKELEAYFKNKNILIRSNFKKEINEIKDELKRKINNLSFK